MSEPRTNRRIRVNWPEGARSDLRAIDRQTALEILHCIDRYLESRHGDVKHLKPPLSGFRMRCGDYRIFFDAPGTDEITITAIRHRSQAYR